MDLVQPPSIRLDWFDRNVTPIFEHNNLSPLVAPVTDIIIPYEVPANRVGIITCVVVSWLCAAYTSPQQPSFYLEYTPSGESSEQEVWFFGALTSALYDSGDKTLSMNLVMNEGDTFTVRGSTSNPSGGTMGAFATILGYEFDS